MKLILVWALAAMAAWGQAAQKQEAAWDDSPHAAQLAAQAARLKPLLDQLKPEEWVAKGAPQTYVTQFQDAQRELTGLSASAAQSDRQPQKLTLALDTYFRLQSLEWRFESLIDAVRKYQNPAVGDLMLSVLRSNSENRDALRAYITELAERNEQELTIVSKDAQACRTELSLVPAAARRNATKK